MMSTESSQTKSWWECRYKLPWNPSEELPFYLHLVIAHRVARLPLLNNDPFIELWRFHRRAGRDDAGHQFRLLLYCSPDVASQVFEEMRNNDTLNQMKEKGLVLKDSYNMFSEEFSATSDPQWPLAIQTEWPHFIHGVSRMWLGLIEQTLAKDTQATSFEEMLGMYKHASEQIDKLWHDSGAHAFLHHLNAIFGYKSLLLRGQQIVF